MQFKTLADIIDFAISREREAADFYREVSKQEALANMRELFLQFAAEEEKHATLLQNLKTGNIGQSLDEYDWKWIIDIKRSNYIVEIAYRPDMPYNEILMLAAKREEKALALYNTDFHGKERAPNFFNIDSCFDAAILRSTITPK